jgi:hypothetical protein
MLLWLMVAGQIGTSGTEALWMGLSEDSVELND